MEPVGEYSGSGGIGLWFANRKYFAGTVTENMIENGDFPVLQVTGKWPDDLFLQEKNVCLRLATGAGKNRIPSGRPEYSMW